MEGSVYCFFFLFDFPIPISFGDAVVICLGVVKAKYFDLSDIGGFGVGGPAELGV